MEFYHSDVVDKVRSRRRDGLSLRALAKEFNIPNSTISRWVKDIAIENPSVDYARKLENSYRMKHYHLVEGLKQDSFTAKVITSILYWCEGYKYPASNHLGFCNSDYAMIKVFIDLLRRGYKIDESKFRVHLQLHDTHNQKKVFEFWSKLLSIPVKQFYKPTITKRTGTMKRRNYMGTCTIKYYDVKLLWQIMGIYKGLIDKFGGVTEWSKVDVC